MFEVIFSTAYGEIVKYAQNEKDLWRLVNIYVTGSQAERRMIYEQILEENKIK